MNHSKSYSIQDVARLVNGKLSHVNAKENILITGVADIRTSTPSHLSFCAQEVYEPYIHTTSAAALLVERGFKTECKVPCALIYVDEVYDALRIFLEDLDESSYAQKVGSEEPNYLGNRTEIGADVYRGAFSYIGNHVRIGDRVKIYPHVYIGDNVCIGSDSIIYAGAYIHSAVEVGQRCVIQSGTVLGSNGFGHARLKDGSYKYIPQIGKLTIEDDVHIGPNSSVDRGTFDQTIIKKGVRIGNHVVVAHNVKVGMHTVISSQTGIAGSCTVGPYCIMGGQVGIASNLHIADHTIIAAQSGVKKDVKKERTTIIGSPAEERRSFVSRLAALSRISRLENQLKKLESLIKTDDV